ncbi:DUF1488 family protein [Paraburkholderia sediminicola]|uniref:DUF1488 family protein n=1 Tax=Paraburkholderia sediminicola TaxID=458836 RepID=UPI0038B6E79E
MAYEMTPGTAPVVVDGDVRFWLTIDGAVQQFQVSHEALADHFGDANAQAPDLLAAFERGRDAICRRAAGAIGAAPVHGAGAVIGLKTHDF